MIKRLLLLLAILFVCGGWNPVSMGGGTPEAGGGGFTSFTDFPVPFEAVGCAGESLTLTETGTELDCDYDNTGLSMGGSEALELTSLAGDEIHNLRMEFDAVDGVQDGNTIECRFLFRVETWGSSTSFQQFFNTQDGIVVDGGYAMLRHGGGSQGQVAARADDFSTDTGGGTISEDTTYKVCFRYDEPNDTTSVFVDAVGGTYCTGAVTSSTQDGANDSPSTANDGIDGVAPYLTSSVGGTQPRLVYDDIDCGNI